MLYDGWTSTPGFLPPNPCLRYWSVAGGRTMTARTGQMDVLILSRELPGDATQRMLVLGFVGSSDDFSGFIIVSVWLMMVPPNH